MITKSGNGFMVESESGKPLSKPGMPQEEARKRLDQIEYFKSKAKGE